MLLALEMVELIEGFLQRHFDSLFGMFDGGLLANFLDSNTQKIGALLARLLPVGAASISQDQDSLVLVNDHGILVFLPDSSGDTFFPDQHLRALVQKFGKSENSLQPGEVFRNDLAEGKENFALLKKVCHNESASYLMR